MKILQPCAISPVVVDVEGNANEGCEDITSDIEIPVPADVTDSSSTPIDSLM